MQIGLELPAVSPCDLPELVSGSLKLKPFWAALLALRVVSTDEDNNTGKHMYTSGGIIIMQTVIDMYLSFKPQI